MQSNTLSTYNTQAVSTDNEIVNETQTSKLAVVECPSKASSTTSNDDTTSRSSDFDFAGLAG